MCDHEQQPKTRSLPPSGSPSGSAPVGSRVSPWLGDYQILNELARGGMGVVYRARQQTLGRQVAIKVMLAGQRAAPAQRERFRLEAMAAARLRHPHIVAIHDVAEQQGCPYLVMDLVEGESLSDRLRRGGPLEQREAADLVRKVAEAVHYAHGRLVLHRDVKPANILLDAAGEPRLTDFGLAKVLDEGQHGPTKTGQLMGTPHYMAPEQVGGRAIDGRVDVYALGATLYALLTGAPPFPETSALELLARVAHEEPQPPSQLRPLDSDLDTICLTCLEKEPERRYPSAKALADDLRRYLENQPIQARRPTLVGRLAKWARRNPATARVGATGLALLLLALGAAVAWVTHTQREASASLRAEARGATEAAWSRLRDAAETDPDTRTGLALEALGAAQRWRDLSLTGAPSAQAQYRAALALGEIALESEQWALAAQAYSLGEGLGVDDEQAHERVEGVGVARRAETERRRREIEGLLERAASGELAQEPEGLVDAVFAIVRYPEAQTVALLSERLSALAAALEALEHDDPPLHEDWLGEENPRLRQLAPRQREGVGQGNLDMARLACDALGRIGSRDEAAVAALGRYLRVEADQLRSVPAGLALCRLGGRDALLHVINARRRLGISSTFSLQVAPALASFPGELAAPASGISDPAHHLIHGDLLQLQGDLAGAELAYARALQLDPSSAYAWNCIGSLRKAEGRREEAIEAFSRAIELEPRWSDPWNNRGAVREERRDFRGALRDLARALELSPESYSAWANQGIVKRKLGDNAGAVRDYSRALELIPSSALILSKRALARRDLGDTNGALADLNRALEIDPRLPLVWNNRAFVRQTIGDAAGAIEDYSRALELDPDYVRAWVNRGNLRLNGGDPAASLPDFSRALELDSAYAPAWVGRGIAWVAVGRAQQALSDLSRGLELGPGNSHAWYMRGNVRASLGDSKGALGDFTRCVELDPDNAPAWSNRGLTRVALGDTAGGVADLERFLELAPDHPNAPGIRARLESLRGQR